MARRRSRCAFPAPPPLAATLLLLLLIASPTSDAAHGRRARTVVRSRPDSSENKYDRSITTFSEDGRLLQVEYGISASNRGETVACLDLDGIVGGGGVCVAAVLGGGSESESESSSESAAEGEGAGVAAADGGGASAPSSSPAARPLAFEERRDKVYRIDDHALLVPTGLSGDGRALASAVRLSCRRMRLSYGEAPMVAEIARSAAAAQHELTRTGGARPFGVTATVVGVDPSPPREGGRWEGRTSSESPDGASSSAVVSGRPRLYQSEPGGVLEEYDFCSAGRGRDRAASRLAEVRRDGLEKRQKLLDEDPASSTTSTAASESEVELMTDMICGVAKAALESYSEPPLSAAEETEKDGNDGRRVDVWLIRSCPERRGGTRIRVARFVRGDEELKFAAKMLAAS